MAGIKYLLQKEVFDTADERILSVCNVSKLLKKKKTTTSSSSYLCVISTSKPRLNVTVVQVKQHDKGVYKKKRTWELDEIKLIDGKSDAADSHELEMQMEKLYKWFTANLHERQNFITVLYKQIQKHCKGGDQQPPPPPKAIFRNVPRAWLVLDGSPTKSGGTSAGGKVSGTAATTTAAAADCSSDESDGYEDFHALTEKEESYLNKLIADCSYAISNAELFMEQMSLNLQDLDGANVQSVLASEKQVEALMEQIETAIQETERVECRLTEYDEILCHTRDSMEKMGEKNSMIDIANKNNIKLLQQLERIVTQLDLPYVHQIALTDTDLTGAAGLAAAIAAGRALQTAMNSDIEPALLQLTAVQDQRKRFEKWKMKFSQTINRHLNNMFIHLGNDLSEAQLHASVADIALSKHTSVHRELSAYSELMHWTKAMDRKAYELLGRVYTGAMSKVYNREISHFFEQARQLVMNASSGASGGLGGSGSGGSGGNTDTMNTSMRDKFKGQTGMTKQVMQPYGVLGINHELWANGVDAVERAKFDGIMERVLAELEPVALSEQMFCIAFFQLDVLSPTTKNTQTTLDASSGGDGLGGGRDEKDSSELRTPSIGE